jgi:phospholipid transport system substrate-binding protein
MNRYWVRVLLCLACFGAAAVAAPAEVATDVPVATVASLQRGLVELSQARPQATLDERYAALAPLVLATHDLPYIAEFALRRQWPTLSEADRGRFVAAFEKLSVMTYAARFASVGPNTFRPIVQAAAEQGGRANVATAVARADGADVSLEYLLQQTPAGWQIVNIVADGVSDLALKRAEYQRILAAGSIDTLIGELEAQTERLRAR